MTFSIRINRLKLQRNIKLYHIKLRENPVVNAVADNMIKKSPYELKVAIGYWNNFNFSCSGTQRWDQAMTELPFFAHITTNASEMTHFADIVLPAAFHMFEKDSFVSSKQNLHGYCSLTHKVVQPMFDVKTDETEICFLLAESLAKKGFDNLLRYYKEQFADPETQKQPTTPEEFTNYAIRFFTKPLWDGTAGAEKGDDIKGWDEFNKLGVWNSKRYSYRKNWGNFQTETKQFEFYSSTLKTALEAHALKHETTVDDILESCNYTARGELAFVPHFEPAFRWGDEKEFPLIFNEHRSRLNREGRSQNSPWYYDMKDADPGDERNADVAKINPITAKEFDVKNGDRIKITSPTGSLECQVKVWEGVRPGTIIKCFGQGHWAYGRTASADFAAKKPRGGNNNDLLPHDTERLSGSNVRHGGVTRVRIEKV